MAPTALIRHIVFFTAKNPATIDTMIEALNALGTIPHVRHFEATRNAKVDQLGNDVDIIVYAEFTDEEALQAYKVHPFMPKRRGGCGRCASCGSPPISGPARNDAAPAGGAAS